MPFPTELGTSVITDVASSATGIVTYNQPSGDNRVILCIIMGRWPSDTTVSSVDYGGQTPTLVLTQANGDTVIHVYAITDDDGLPADGNNDFTAVMNEASADWSVMVIGIQDADPIPSDTDPVTGSGTSLTNSTAANANDMLVQLVLVNSGTSAAVSWGDGQAELHDVDVGSNRNAAAKFEGMTGGAETWGASWTASAGYIGVALSFTEIPFSPDTTFGLGTVNTPHLPLVNPSTTFGLGTVFSPTIQQFFTIPNQRPILASPGLASYKVRLKDQDGQLVAEFDTWRALQFTHKVNDRGTVRFEINGEDNRVSLFELDGQIEIWRRNLILDLDWYLEWEGFYRTNNDTFYQNDNNSFIAYGFSYLDLARRAEIKYTAGSAYATKSGVSETVMKELVGQNIGVAALATNGRAADNVMPGLGVEADGGGGAAWEGTVADKNLLSTLQQISLASQQVGTVIDFDIVGIEDALFEFRTYEGQRGTDRTKNNADGNSPVIFSLGFGNMVIPVLSEDRSTEITAAYALGRGTDDAKQFYLAENDAKYDSPWNRIEKTVSASGASGEDQDAQLQSKAEEILEKNKFDTRLGFNVLQLQDIYYGKHYTWGDLVTARFKGNEFSKKLVEARVNVSANAQGERIEAEFADN
jgi:hypothetical protein